MSLNISTPPATRKVERPRIAQRVAAIFGLAGLVMAWAVVLLPCALWLGFSLLVNRSQAALVRQRA